MTLPWQALTVIARKAGATWALAFSFCALLGYASFLQIRASDAASIGTVAAIEARLTSNEVKDAATHANVAATLELMLEELRALRADMRAVMLSK